MKTNWIEFIVGLKSDSVAFKSVSNPFTFKIKPLKNLIEIKRHDMFVKPDMVNNKPETVEAINNNLIETHTIVR